MGIAQNAEQAIVGVKYVGPGNIVGSVKGPGLHLALVLVRVLSVDAIIRVDVLVNAKSPFVGSRGRSHRGVEVKPAAGVLWRRPVVPRGELVRKGVNCPGARRGYDVARIGIAYNTSESADSWWYAGPYTSTSGPFVWRKPERASQLE